MEKVYIVGAKRTPIGSFLGSLKDVSAGDLGSIAIKAALEESNVHLNDVDEVLMGNVLSAGQGQGIARQTAIKAGLGVRVPATALNIACGSGMKAVMNAVQAIRAEDAHVIVAGGVESMSQTPHLIPGRNRSGHKMGSFEVVDHMLHDGLTDASKVIIWVLLLRISLKNTKLQEKNKINLPLNRNKKQLQLWMLENLKQK